MFIQEKPFWIARVIRSEVICKKMTAEQLNDFNDGCMDIHTRWKTLEGRLDYLSAAIFESNIKSRLRRIINRGTDGIIGMKHYQWHFDGGYAVSFESKKAARLIAEEMLEELKKRDAEADAEAAKAAEKKAKYTEKHLDNKRKVWMLSYLADRYGCGDTYERQVTIGDVAAAERDYYLDKDIDPMPMFDLMMAKPFDGTSPLKKVLKLVKTPSAKRSKTVGIMTEEGYHVFSTNKAEAKKAFDKQMVKEMTCDW